MSLIGRAESRLLRLLLVLITLLMAQPAAADVADGVRAFRAQDYATAYRLLLPAAEAGDREAQYWLSMVLDIGSGIGGSSKEANRAAADVWRRKAAKQGHAKALAELGQIYHESFQFDLAFEYSLKAAQADGRSGTWKIGFMYCFGQGLPRDSFESDAWTAIGFAPFQHNVEAWQGLQCEFGGIVTREYLLQVNQRAQQIRRRYGIPSDS